MDLLLAVGRIPSRRGAPETEGGYKIYLTTRDRNRWVEFGGGGRKNDPNGLPAQKRNGRESAEAAWQWVEEHLLTNQDLVSQPMKFHDLWPYDPNSPHMAEILWGTQRPLGYRVGTNDETPNSSAAAPPDQQRSLFDDLRDVKKYERPERPNQAAFRLAVFERYGARCSFCHVAFEQLLDAAHIIGWNEKGADIVENGIVLCKLHHCALDAGMIRIHPGTLELRCSKGFHRSDLYVQVSNIKHLPSVPDPRALQWLWERFEP